jgi:hypothetical protein
VEDVDDHTVIIQQYPPAFPVTLYMPGPDAPGLERLCNAVRYGLRLPGGSAAAYKKIIAETRRQLAHIQYNYLFSLLILCFVFNKS